MGRGKVKTASQPGVLFQEAIEVVEDDFLFQLPHKGFAGYAFGLRPAEVVPGDAAKGGAVSSIPRLARLGKCALFLGFGDEILQDLMHQGTFVHGGNREYLFRVLQSANAEHMAEEIAKGATCPGLKAGGG
jgi:hypothetical protein